MTNLRQLSDENPINPTTQKTPIIQKNQITQIIQIIQNTPITPTNPIRPNSIQKTQITPIIRNSPKIQKTQITPNRCCGFPNPQHHPPGIFNPITQSQNIGILRILRLFRILRPAPPYQDQSVTKQTTPHRHRQNPPATLHRPPPRVLHIPTEPHVTSALFSCGACVSQSSPAALCTISCYLATSRLLHILSGICLSV